MGQFAVIGLGRFGSAASRELMKLGHSVLGVDSSGKIVDRYADELSHAVIADVTDKQALEEALRRRGIPAVLYQDVEHHAVLVDGASEIVQLTANFQEHLIKNGRASRMMLNCSLKIGYDMVPFQMKII